MSSKTKNKRNSPSIIKNGTATSILSGCDKPFIADHLTDYRDKYNRIKTEYDKAQVKSEQMDQYVVENKKLIAKNQQQHTEIIQLNSQIKVLKETSVDRGDAQRLEGKIKKKDHEIEELKKQIDSTKINAVASLENQIVKLKAENEKLKEGDCKSRFDMIRVLSDDIKKVSDENIQLKKAYEDYQKYSCELGDCIDKQKEEKDSLKEENIQLKKDNETLKEEHGELIEKLDKFQKIITNLYDDF